MVKGRDFDKTSLRRGTWSPEEDQKLIAYISRYGIWNWTEMPKPAGLLRTGKSCRLRWMNYLRPDIKRGNFSLEDEQIIIKLHQELGNRWSAIAARLPGRTDNEIKNYWHTRLSKKFLKNKLVPTTVLQKPQRAHTETIQKTPSEVDSLFPNSPNASNLEVCQASPLPSQLSTDDYFSSSSDPATFEIYEIQNAEDSIVSSETYGDLQSLLELSISMESLYMAEGYGTTDPGFMMPTSEEGFSDEELQTLLEQPFPAEVLDMVEDNGATDPGFVTPTSQEGFSNGELPSFLEQPFPIEGLDMVQGDMITDTGFVTSTPRAGFSNEQLKSLLENPFPIEGLYVAEGYGAVEDPRIEVSTSQRVLQVQEDPYASASNHDAGNDFWPYF